MAISKRTKQILDEATKKATKSVSYRGLAKPEHVFQSDGGYTLHPDWHGYTEQGGREGRSQDDVHHHLHSLGVPRTHYGSYHSPYEGHNGYVVHKKYRKQAKEVFGF